MQTRAIAREASFVDNRATAPSAATLPRFRPLARISSSDSAKNSHGKILAGLTQNISKHVALPYQTGAKPR